MNRINHNGDSPGAGLRENVGHLAKDVVCLVELQGELLQAEVRDWVRHCLTPVAILAVVAGALSMASLPLLLFSLAYCLRNYAEWPMWLAALTAGGVGMLIAGACLVAAWIVVNRQAAPLARSKTELSKNVRWLKQVLTHPVAASKEDPR
jgi:hypothetical protein